MDQINKQRKMELFEKQIKINDLQIHINYTNLQIYKNKEIKCIHEVQQIIRENKKNNNEYWYYEINARTGKPGFADDETYTSEKFNSFEDCYKNYDQFDYNNHWYDLRRIQNEYIYYFDGNKLNINKSTGGLIQFNELFCIYKLGITELEFDIILEKIIINK